jgi:Ca-activated chloride channel homolog
MTMPFGLSFASPWILLLLLALPIWWYWRRRRRAVAIVFSRTDVLAAAPPRGAHVSRWLFLLRNVAIAAIIVAVAGPRTGARVETITSEGINIAVVVDISSSMLARDFQPHNRMEVARQTAGEFIAARRGDRVALVAFAGEALTQVPLTADYAVLQAAISNLQPGLLEDGTAIGTAIVTAANRLRDAPGPSRVMVLLTDGENNRGAVDPRTAARAAAAFDIRIHTIGVGIDGLSPVPVGRGIGGGLRYEMRHVSIDEPLLQDVATFTGGRYFRARDPGALQRIYQEIDQLERVPIRTRSYVRFSERFRWPLALALLALTLEIGLFARRGPLP